MEDNEVCCETCYYWKFHLSNNSLGTCHRFPPFNSAQTITSKCH